ncbi:MAG: hypothetical protein HQL69_22025 [Magnetococcales bacterium]|nr:hypothetical protein [Magnetococcales bacterium]
MAFKYIVLVLSFCAMAIHKAFVSKFISWHRKCPTSTLLGIYGLAATLFFGAVAFFGIDYNKPVSIHVENIEQYKTLSNDYDAIKEDYAKALDSLNILRSRLSMLDVSKENLKVSVVISKEARKSYEALIVSYAEHIDLSLDDIDGSLGVLGHLSRNYESLKNLSDKNVTHVAELIAEKFAEFGELAESEGYLNLASELYLNASFLDSTKWYDKAESDVAMKIMHGEDYIDGFK